MKPIDSCGFMLFRWYPFYSWPCISFEGEQVVYGISTGRVVYHLKKKKLFSFLYYTNLDQQVYLWEYLQYERYQCPSMKIQFPEEHEWDKGVDVLLKRS